MNRRGEYPVIQFYKGHFYQQLAQHSSNIKNIQHFRERALCFYQNYLELNDDRSDESKYYAQWQTGMLQDSLCYPWLLAENSLLKASAIDPLRGEAIKKIIEHYMRYRDWSSAYHYSTIAIEQFFDKNPVARRRWFIDFAAYNQNVIRTNRFICYKLGYLKEISAANGTVNHQTVSQPGKF
jgi:hypothetical protein